MNLFSCGLLSRLIHLMLSFFIQFFSTINFISVIFLGDTASIFWVWLLIIFFSYLFDFFLSVIFRFKWLLDILWGISWYKDFIVAIFEDFINPWLMIRIPEICQVGQFRNRRLVIFEFHRLVNCRRSHWGVVYSHFIDRLRFLFLILNLYYFNWNFNFKILTVC